MEKRTILMATWGIITLAVVGLFAYSLYSAASPTITGSVIETPEIEQSMSNKEQSSTEETGITESDTSLSSDLINAVLALREADMAEDLILTAEQITDINSLIDDLDQSQVSAAWFTVLDCVYDTCSTSAYFDLIDQIVLNSRGSQAPIHLVIQTERLWTGKNQILFSEAITTTHNTISKSGNEKAIALWDSIVECSNSCPQSTELVFSLIKALNN